MTRPLRLEFPDAIYARGNARAAIYLDDEDRQLFLDVLAESAKRFRWLCHAYCLMDNHYHLLIETPEGNLSNGMRQLNGIYNKSPSQGDGGACWGMLASRVFGLCRQGLGFKRTAAASRACGSQGTTGEAHRVSGWRGL